MRQLILFAVLAILCFRALGYDSSKINTYYKYVYAAEQDIIDTKYDAAAANYARAFKSGIAPFAADIYNNLVTGLRTNNNARVLEMAKLLVLKGADTCVFRRSVYSRFRKTAEWQKLLRDYPMLKKQREKIIDGKLAQQVKDLLDADQRFTIAAYHQDKPVTDEVKKEYDRLMDSVYTDIQGLMEKYDYLSEEKIGITYEDDTDLEVSPTWHVIIWHCFEDHHEPSLINPLLAAIESGKMKSEYGMRNLDLHYKYSYAFDYSIENDTLFKTDRNNMFYNGNKVFPNQRLDILARKPTPEEAWFRKLYYVDTPEAIERKIRYIFREGYCKWKHPEYPGAGEAMFVFYLSNGPGKMDNDKALEVCGSK